MVKTKITGLLIWAVLHTGCVSIPTPPIAYSNVGTFEELETKVTNQRKPTLTSFEKRGPFKYRKIVSHQIPINRQEKILCDLFLPRSDEKLPLVIISHGNEASKEAHRYQAERLATWGFNVITVSLPNVKQWLLNGKRIEKLTKLIFRSPELVSSNIDTDAIILMGHSFGGSAITLATGAGAPAKGLILLDPAVVHSDVKAAARKVNVPVILLGADTKVFQSRQRELFYQEIAGEMLEVSFRGATHNDAQYPTIFATRAFGYDPDIHPELQEKFLAAIVSSAFSIAGTDSIEFAWRVFKKSKVGVTFKMVKIRSPEDKPYKYASLNFLD